MTAWRRTTDTETGRVVDQQSETERELREQVKALRRRVKELEAERDHWMKLASK